MTKDEALLMALEAMESVTVECNNFHHPKKDQNHHWAKCPPIVRWDKAITAIKEALAQPDPYKQGYTDAMNWKVQNHLEHLPTAKPEQEPVAWGVDWGKAGDMACVSIIKRLPNDVIEVVAVEYAPYSYTHPPQPLTEEQKREGFRQKEDEWTFRGMTVWQIWVKACEWTEAAHGIKEDT